MPTIIEITDLSAPELAVYTRLTEAQLRNKLEPEKGIFIAESPKVIGTALDAGCVPLSFLMERPHIEGSAAAVLARCPDTPVYTAPRETLQTLTGYALTRGVLCAMRRPKQHTVEELCQTARRVAVLEGIVDSTNIGAIFRSAAALGMDAVLLSPSCCDPLCRRAVRVSMGTVFQVPWARLGGEKAPNGPRPVWTACTNWALRPPPWRWTTAPLAWRTRFCRLRTSWPSCWAPRATVWPPTLSPGAITPL